MDTRTKGAWIVHHGHKLSLVVNSLEYETILTAGKAGVLLSGLSANEQVSLPNDKVDAIRKAARVSKTELPALLKSLSDLGVINVGKSGIEVLGVTSHAVLEHTAHLYDSMSPGTREHAALEFAELVSDIPQEQRVAIERVSDEFRFPTSDAQDFIVQCEEIGFADAESLDGEKKLYFNGNIFRRKNAKKMEAVFSSLSTEDVRRFVAFDQVLREQGAAMLRRAKTELGDQLFDKLHAVGALDVSEVANTQERVLYVTRPAAFGKFGNPFADDALDLARAFVTCLTYGMTRRSSGTGRITMVKQLLRRLIEGQWVGSATAIGEDYRVLEMKRVVELRHSQGSRYDMRLLKQEIGELAYEVISLGEAAESALALRGAPVSQYTRPEEIRTLNRKKQNRESRRATADILTALRTGVR